MAMLKAAFAGIYTIDVDANRNCLHPSSVLASTVRKTDLDINVSFASAGELDAGIHLLSLAEDCVGYALDGRCVPHVSAQVNAEAGCRRQVVAGCRIAVRDHAAELARAID